MSRVDVVVAVRNEQQSIPVFLDQLAALALPPGVSLKVIFVEDSSTDDTRPMLRRLAAQRRDVGYCMLAKGHGQALAVAVGLDASNADAMIMMDVDGSHPVAVIPDMIRAHLGGARVVQCVRRSLVNRPLYRQIGAALFQLMARVLMGVDIRDQNIYYRLVARDVGKSLIQPRYWHYLRFPLPREDGALHKITIDTRERALGASKYDFVRLLRLAVDAVTSLMSPRRVAVILTVSGVFAIAAFAVGAWPVGLTLLVACALLWRRWRILHDPSVFGRIEIVERANVP